MLITFGFWNQWQKIIHLPFRDLADVIMQSVLKWGQQQKTLSFLNYKVSNDGLTKKKMTTALKTVPKAFNVMNILIFLSTYSDMTEW